MGAHTAMLVAANQPRRINRLLMVDVDARDGRSITASTHIILGEHGNVDADQIARMRHLQPSARLQTIVGAGHNVHLEQPAAWHQALKTALDAGPSTAGDEDNFGHD
jgi:hypothetical protein